MFIYRWQYTEHQPEAIILFLQQGESQTSLHACVITQLKLTFALKGIRNSSDPE